MMERRAQFLLSTLFLLCLSAPVRAADINAASCSDTDVQAAIDSAVDGDRVLIPAGSCTWTVEVTSTNKGITLEGAGVANTTIINGTGGRAMRFFLEAGDPTFILTAFTYDHNNIGGSTIGMTMTGGGLDAFRIHHIDFINLNGTGLSIDMDGLEVSGLVDNNLFDMPVTSGSKSIRIFGTGPSQHQPFSRPIELGSEKFIFVEDNTFDFDDANDGSQDCFGGARYVFRHNTVINTKTGHHGADSGNFRGIHSFEIYDNTYNRTAAGNIRMHHLRSSTGVLYNNTYTGNYGQLTVTNFRCDESQGFAGICDGTSIWDENQPSTSGYACLDQIGHVFTENSGGDNDLVPFYVWNNRHEGVRLDATVNGHSCSAYIVEDRDFYDEAASFDGTSGVGMGTLAARPATCAPEVGYWATDESKFYQCSSTDTWTLYYEPFTYPHPLQNTAGLTGNVRIQGDVRLE